MKQFILLSSGLLKSLRHQNKLVPLCQLLAQMFFLEQDTSSLTSVPFRGFIWNYVEDSIFISMVSIL